jgi:hypothetical protein
MPTLRGGAGRYHRPARSPGPDGVLHLLLSRRPGQTRVPAPPHRPLGRTAQEFFLSIRQPSPPRQVAGHESDLRIIGEIASVWRGEGRTHRSPSRGSSAGRRGPRSMSSESPESARTRPHVRPQSRSRPRPDPNLGPDPDPTEPDPNLGPDPDPSPAQPSPAQPSPAQPSPAQPSPAQPSPAQPSLGRMIAAAAWKIPLRSDRLGRRSRHGRYHP